MVGLYGLSTIGVQMQKPDDLNPHLKFKVRFTKEAVPRDTVYTIADVNKLAWSRIDGIFPCGYDFPPIDTECEVKCKHGWESCEIVAHNNLVIRLLRTGELLVLDPAHALFTGY